MVASRGTRLPRSRPRAEDIRGSRDGVVACGMRFELRGKNLYAHGVQRKRKFEGEAHTFQRYSKIGKFEKETKGLGKGQLSQG